MTGNGDFLIVRDNKEARQNRAALVSFTGGTVSRVRPLTWHGPVPVDLESIAAVPGRPGQFVALSSSGKGMRVVLAGDRVVVLRTFTVPAVQDKDNYEGFALTVVKGRTVAVWANRGQDSRPGRLIAAEVDLGRMEFGPITSATIRAPYPKKDVRHISDIVVTDSGRVLASAATDSGDDGPFDSAVYPAADLSVDNGAVALKPVQDNREIARYPDRKIEAMTCLTPSCDRMLLGTDDENLGGWVRFS
ncbi:hypothetical protein [Allokutzneria oryzae]|uniref:Uncharacterized protein n=1 Tax=Allokutzneria oryzae TaxID=1378989 RepID=A0ABV5ZSH4_9PSEU